MFWTLYRPLLLAGIKDFAKSRELSIELICSEVEAQISAMFLQMDEDHKSASVLRRECLNRLAPHFSRFKTFQTCLYCVRRKPEHVLDCGHSICDVCIVIFGDRVKGLEYHFDLHSCLMCHAMLLFRARPLPPTCGVRFISIAGGGARGIVPLTYLDALQDTLGLSYPIQEHFDFSIGTSSGKSRLRP